MRRLLPALALLLAARAATAQVTVIDDFAVDQAPGTVLDGVSLFGRRNLTEFPILGTSISGGALQIAAGSSITALRYGSTLGPLTVVNLTEAQNFVIRWSTPGDHLPAVSLHVFSGPDDRARVLLPEQAGGGTGDLVIPIVDLFNADMSEHFALEAVIGLTLTFYGSNFNASPATVSIDAWWITGNVVSVPEPAPAALLVVGLAAALLRRRSAQ